MCAARDVSMYEKEAEDSEIESKYGKLRTRWELIRKCEIDKADATLLDDYLHRAQALEKDVTEEFNASKTKKHTAWLKTLMENVVEWIDKVRKKIADADAEESGKNEAAAKKGGVGKRNSTEVVKKGSAGGGGGGGWDFGPAKCTMCDGPHWMSRCPIPLADKKKAIKDKDLCRHCGTFRHKTQYCPKKDKLKCFVCAGPHYGCLHYVVCP